MTSPWSGYHPPKEKLRQQIWDRLEKSGATEHPPHGHIPNFIGAERAADQLSALPIWQAAQVVKFNPDKPQIPVRAAALAAGKTLYMAVPRLVDDHCFIALHRDDIPGENPDWLTLAQKENVLRFGRPVAFAEMKPIDLVVVGSVAASPAGGRTGKGAGFADLELAMLQHFDLLKPATQIVTTIHAAQLVTPDLLPLEAHDWSLDWICTPEQAINTQQDHPRPQGLDWQKIRPQQWQSIPILQKLYDPEKSA